MKALVIGGSSWDTLIHVDELGIIKDDMSLWANSVVETVGGTGAGKALCLDALGEEVILVTDIGKDVAGNKIMSYFERTKIKVIPLLVDTSTTHTNIMHSMGKRLSIFTSVPTVDASVPAALMKQLSDTDIIFLNINNFCRGFIPFLKTLKKSIIVDIHDYDPPNPYHDDFIEIADIIIASGVNIVNHQQFLKELIQRGKKLVVITLGSDGLIALDSEGNEYNLKGYTDFKYVDSNGAGDSFVAGLITHYFQSKNIGESLKFGTICGGIACSSYELFNRDFDQEKVLRIKKEVEF